jgi:RND family efflux transporter MFP subunit
MKLNSTLKKRLIPLAILGIAIVASVVIMGNPPKAKRWGGSKAPQMMVEAKKLQPQLFQVQVDSFGNVRPRVESVLVSQASGQINYINDNFRDGGFFEKGEVLIKLDDRDARADVKIAEANFLDAKQKLVEEKARAEQALTDWQRLGKKGTPSSLVLREPQLAAAQAKLLSSEAQLAKAKLSLERTQIAAPYAGRVLQKKVDLGQVISNNSQLADIYSVDVVEVRLPIKNQDLALLDLPEEFRGEQGRDEQTSGVIFSGTTGEGHWSGELVRTEGAIDESSQQLYVVAQIKDPYALVNKSAMPIKIGQYLSAQVSGKLLSNAIVVPVKSIYQGSYVYVVEEGLLMRRQVELLWKNKEQAIVKSGLNGDEVLVTTALGQVSSGTPVSISGQENKRMANAKGAAKGNMQERLARMPAKVREKIKQEAKERGVSVEQVMKEKRKARMANGG